MIETQADAAPEMRGGALLRQAREATGVHVAALAVALKVPVRQLEALEQDRLDLLPDPTFARALASSVCRQLRIDPRPILEALPPQASAGLSNIPDGSSEPFEVGGRTGFARWKQLALRPSSLVVLALLLGAMTLVLAPVSQTPRAVEAPSAGPAAPAPAAPASSGMVVEPVTPGVAGAPPQEATPQNPAERVVPAGPSPAR